MIPMRDGVKLHTVIVVPKARRTRRSSSLARPTTRRGAPRNAVAPHAGHAAAGDDVFVADGYIRAFQDVRGKYGSEGDYVMTRPLRAAERSKVDHSTDAYDTIDWLVKNVPESNGRVGMIGCSYEGFTA